MCAGGRAWASPRPASTWAPEPASWAWPVRGVERRELAHACSVRPDERLPGTQAVLVRDGLGDEATQERRDVRLAAIGLLHAR